MERKNDRFSEQKQDRSDSYQNCREDKNTHNCKNEKHD